jgi:hypothetical protein
MPSEGCFEPDYLELPGPEWENPNCGAGVSPPGDPPTEPPPTPGTYISLRVYEEGDVRQFPQYLYASNEYPLRFPNDRIIGSAGFRGDAAFGERVYFTGFIGFPYYGGLHPPLYWGLPGYSNLQTNRAFRMEILMGNRRGPLNLAPPVPLPYLPDNHIFIRSIRTWQSLSPFVIESWRPFVAHTCATNMIKGHGPETQFGSLQSFGNVGQPFPGINYWSPASAALAGSTIRLRFEERPPFA